MFMSSVVFDEDGEKKLLFIELGSGDGMGFLKKIETNKAI